MDIVTLVIAVYGAVLSTLLGILEIRKLRRNIRVICRMAVAAGPGSVAEVVEICAVNVGHRPIQITGAGFHTTNEYHVIPSPVNTLFGPWPLPKRLEDNDSVSVYMLFSDLQEAIQQQGQNVVYESAYVTDAEGKKHRGALPKVMKERGLTK